MITKSFDSFGIIPWFQYKATAPPKINFATLMEELLRIIFDPKIVYWEEAHVL